MRIACTPIRTGLALLLACLLTQSCMVRDRPEGFGHFDEVTDPGARVNVDNSPITFPKETPKGQPGETKKPPNEQSLPSVDPPKKTSFVGSAPLGVTCKMPTKTPSYLGSTKTFRVSISATMKVLPPSERVAAMAVVKPWRSGHPIAIHGQRILALDRLNGNLVVADRGSMVIKVITKLGGRPYQLVVAPSGVAYITVRDKGAVAVVLPGDEGEITWWKTGRDPRGIALSGDAKRLYVAVTAEDKVVVLDAISGALLQDVAVSQSPTTVATTPENMLVVGYHKVAATLHPTTTDTNGKAIVDKGKAVPLKTDWLTGKCMGKQMKPGEQARFANRVMAIDIEPETAEARMLHTIVTPGTPTASLQTAMAAMVDKNGDIATQSLQTGYGSGCFNNKPVEPGVTTVNGAGTLSAEKVVATPVVPWLEGNASPGMMNVKQMQPTMSQWLDQPTDIAHHPTHRLMLVTGRGSDRVLVVRTVGAKSGGSVQKSLDVEQAVAVYSVGNAPIGVAIAADGETAYTLDEHSLSITALDLTLVTDPGGLSSSSEGATIVPFAACGTKRVFFGNDPASEDVRAGRRLFTFSQNHQIASNGQFACASCHIEGDEDGMVWHTPEGPRQTPRLAGRLKGTHPFNWVGSEDELPANMDKTIKRMGGSGFSDSQLKQLEAFLLTGLSAPPAEVKALEELTPLESAGAKLFHDPTVGCGNCHISGDGVDGKLHDVGTGDLAERTIAALLAAKVGTVSGKSCQKDGLSVSCSSITAVKGIKYDTPSLKGVGRTAPYLHDGSAKTLKQALLLTKDQMGKTGELSTAQLDALVAYLKTL
jgi:DNA-binding beta-propeller fold protein YncE